jgi:hypothetical protein
MVHASLSWGVELICNQNEDKNAAQAGLGALGGAGVAYIAILIYP